MPDPFFVSSKGQKRKRAPTASSSSKTTERAPKKQNRGQPARATKSQKSGSAPTTKKRVDEELQSDDGSRGDGGNVDDLDLTRSDSDDGASGEEDEHETPAEKRLRLARLYLESVKKDIGMLIQSDTLVSLLMPSF